MKNKIYLAHRTQSQAYAKFMLQLQGCRIHDLSGKEVRKLDWFNAIFREHAELYPGIHFDINRNVKFKLLCGGLLLDYKLIGTPEKVEYDDDLVYKERAREEIKKRCNCLCRTIGVGCDGNGELKLTYDKLIDTAVDCCMNIFENHASVETEIDKSYV